MKEVVEATVERTTKKRGGRRREGRKGGQQGPGNLQPGEEQTAFTASVGATVTLEGVDGAEITKPIIH